MFLYFSLRRRFLGSTMLCQAIVTSLNNVWFLCRVMDILVNFRLNISSTAHIG